MPVRRRRPRGAHPGHRPHGVQLALLRPRRRSRHALRLPRVRALRARGGPPLQPGQAAHRSVRQGDRGGRRLGRGQRAALRARSRGSGGRRPRARRRGLRARDPQVAGHRRGLRLGGRHPPAHAVEPDGHLRGARQGLHEAAPRGPRGPARHVRRPGLRAGDALPQGPRRDRRRAAADPPHRRRELPRRAGADELLGLQLDRLPRAARRLRRDRRHRRADPRVQGHGQGPAPRGHRGDPRRGLQPHRRGQPPGPDAQLQGRRQQVLLPPRPRRRALLHGLHGHRQLAQRRPPEHAAAHHGLAALLGHRVPRRRVPLRPGQRPGPRALRRRPPVGVLRHDPPGPRPVAGQAHRRALGRRARRLPGRQLPRAVVGVERHLPRRHARLLAWAGRRRRLRRAPGRLQRPVRARRAQPVRVDQLHHRPRRLPARRSRRVQREAQRGEQGGQPRRDRRQPVLELRRRGPDGRPGDQRAAHPPAAQLPRHAHAVAGRPDAPRRRRALPHPARQQQRLVPGQRDLLVRVGHRRGGPAAPRLHEAAHRPPPGPSRVPPPPLPQRRRVGGVRAAGRLVVPHGRPSDDAARLGAAATCTTSACSSTARSSRTSTRAASASRTTRSCCCSTPITRTSSSGCRTPATARAGASSSPPPSRRPSRGRGASPRAAA